MAYDGSDHRLILHGIAHLSHPFAISILDDKLYWSEWNRNAIVQVRPKLNLQCVRTSM